MRSLNIFSVKRKGYVSYIISFVLAAFVLVLLFTWIPKLTNTHEGTKSLFGIDSYKDLVIEGDKSYEDSEFGDAIHAYKKALKKSKSSGDNLARTKVKIAFSYAAREKYGAAKDEIEDVLKDYNTLLSPETKNRLSQIVENIDADLTKGWFCCDVGELGDYYVYNICSNSGSNCNLQPLDMFE